MDGNNFTIQFEPSENPDDRKVGWGRGIVYFGGNPYWHGEENGDVAPFEWTWVDLLEFFAKNWNELLSEEAYPFPWIPTAQRSINSIWRIADDRWSNLPSAKAQAEELELIKFINRHNIASAWKGAAVPELMCLRAGNFVCLIGQDETPIMVRHQDFVAEITSFGDAIVNAMEDSEDPYVCQVIQLWRDRSDIPFERKISIVTSLPIETVIQIQGEAANDYWIHDGEIDEQIAVAARMVRNHLGAQMIRNVLDSIKAVPLSETPKLDFLSRRFNETQLLSDDDKPYEQGYRIAAWLTNELGLRAGARVDPDAVLTGLNVHIGSANFGDSGLEALAIWGGRGPAVLLNESIGGSKKRSTALAHELCHLVVDRTRLLPAAEVLGGSVDIRVEQRAKAFAAEFLLPRELVVQLRYLSQSLEDFVSLLERRFHVSSQVAIYQIQNSTLHLTGDEAIWLNEKLRRISAASSLAAFR
ncbi:ImmA/IrrE family metallo-endopeptidase [Paraburkholderia tropica]|uniref:ImmA/IrrE family metallo-endopeptidase n=1 Tax=Paraburkholderia tropica TaxID=92647 RepID=UPI002AB7F2AF|nr:ImmA/IrrE family metallo-endopeptidase [Paraburkholderia tropica]